MCAILQQPNDIGRMEIRLVMMEIKENERRDGQLAWDGLWTKDNKDGDGWKLKQKYGDYGTTRSQVITLEN